MGVLSKQYFFSVTVLDDVLLDLVLGATGDFWGSNEQIPQT